MTTRKHPYRGIRHPAISKVSCPYCISNVEHPCTKRMVGYSTKYTETHEARIKRYEAMKEDFNDR